MLQEAAEAIESESERILWLPPITLGYLYTITDWKWHFILTVVGIAGGRLFYDVVQSSAVDQGAEEGPKVDQTALLKNQSQLSSLGSILTGTLAIAYLISVIASVQGLIHQFQHNDAVIVALSDIYAGIAVVAVINFLTKQLTVT